MTPIAKKPEERYRCTGCSSHIRYATEAFLHPLLKVLVCKKCHDDYGTGDFSLINDPDIGPGVDENGDDNYCRWCVDGGDLFACGNGDAESPNRCHYAFCSECIRRNCPKDEVLDQENQEPGAEFKWECYACDKEKLKNLRKEAQDIILALSSRDLKRPTVTVNLLKDSEKDKDRSTTARTPAREKDSDKSKSEKDKVREKEANSENRNDKVHNEAQLSVPTPNSVEIQTQKKNKADSGSSNGTSLLSKDQDITSEDPHSQKKRRTESNGDSRNDTSRKEVILVETEGQAQKKRKADSSSHVNEAFQKEPEASSMPPVAPPKPPESALRRLSKKSATPEVPKNVGQKVTQSNPSEANTLPSSIAPKAYSRTLPSSVNNVTKVKLPSSKPSNPQMSESPKLNGGLLKSRPLSKQLKTTTEPIKPSTKVALTEAELDRRLDNLGRVKENCVKEIDNKFTNILEMFRKKDLSHNRSMIKFELKDLERPIQEFASMLRDLESLCHSQS